MSAPELVLLFADADAERFVTPLIERGIERRCLRPFAWRAVRDPMHDALVARDPAAPLAPLLVPGEWLPCALGPPLDALAKKRSALRVPTPASAEDPKASFRAAARAQRLRVSPALFEELGQTLSIEKLKAGEAMGRLARVLVEWFGAEGRA